MTKPIILSEKNWLAIYDQIAKEYPPSVLLIRDRMRKVLGCTSRRHREWAPEPGYDGYGTYINTIHLDFYNEPKRTMFLLKYSDYIGKTNS
jgi:hypothetical protein